MLKAAIDIAGPSHKKALGPKTHTLFMSWDAVSVEAASGHVAEEEKSRKGRARISEIRCIRTIPTRFAWRTKSKSRCNLQRVEGPEAPVSVMRPRAHVENQERHLCITVLGSTILDHLHTLVIFHTLRSFTVVVACSWPFIRTCSESALFPPMFMAKDFTEEQKQSKTS